MRPQFMLTAFSPPFVFPAERGKSKDKDQRDDDYKVTSFGGALKTGVSLPQSADRERELSIHLFSGVNYIHIGALQCGPAQRPRAGEIDHSPPECSARPIVRKNTNLP